MAFYKVLLPTLPRPEISRLMAGHACPIDWNWRMRSCSILAISWYAKTITSTKPTLWSNSIKTLLLTILSRWSLRRNRQLHPFRSNRTYPNKTTNPAHWRETSVCRSRRLYSQNLCRGRVKGNLSSSSTYYIKRRTGFWTLVFDLWIPCAEIS